MKHPIRGLLIAPLLILAAACSSNSAKVPSALVELNPGGDMIASGSFSGRNDHVVTGAVQIVNVDGAYFLRLGPGFTLDGAPDPRIGFGRSGEYDTTTTFTDLAEIKGEQTYRLPDGFELGTLNEATIWCDDFSVALGVAPLN